MGNLISQHLRTITKEQIRLHKEILVQLRRLEKAEERLADFNEYAEKQRQKYMEAMERPTLTEREKLILELRKQGLTLREIAPKVGLTYGSLKHVSARIRKKTDEVDRL